MKLSEKINGISTNVNLLRFFAAVLVIFSHSFSVAALQEDPFFSFCNGQIGLGGLAVAILFFLSGFYVTKSLYKKNDLKDYFYKRCQRIFPQLWIVVVASVFIFGPMLSTYSLGRYFTSGETYLYLLNGILIPVHDLPGVFANNIYNATVNGPLWTMPVEFAAYCMLAVILMICKYVFKNEKFQKLMHIMCVCVFFIMFVFCDVFLHNDFLMGVIRPLIMFFAGALYYDYVDKIILNTPLAISMVLISILLCRIGFLNYGLMVCLPYIIVVFCLGMKQSKIQSKIMILSYEMYLLGVANTTDGNELVRRRNESVC